MRAFGGLYYVNNLVTLAKEERKKEICRLGFSEGRSRRSTSQVFACDRAIRGVREPYREIIESEHRKSSHTWMDMNAVTQVYALFGSISCRVRYIGLP